jgi:steroid delta-isomerase-like uncharacterized protein
LHLQYSAFRATHVHNEENLMRHRAVVPTILALAIALLAGPSLLQAQEASPSAEGSSILATYGQAWSSGDAAQVAALYTEDAVREDIPTGTTSRGRAEIEALATGLFETDADVRLVVTDGFVGESWAVVEWTFTGIRQATGGEVTFRGASVLELEDGLIRLETDYYDLPQMQQQIAAAGGTPGALETPTGGTDATPAATTAAGQTGSVTIRVFTCPAEMSQAAGQGELDQAALLAGCTPRDAPETAPTLRTLPDGEPMAGTATQPGVYGWDGLAFSDYAIGSSGEMPADLGGLLATDASGAPLQNPVLQLDEMSPHVEYHYFYFLVEATPAA